MWVLLQQEEKKPEEDSVNKRRRKGNHYLSEVGGGLTQRKFKSTFRLPSRVFTSFPARGVQLSCHSAPPAGEDGELRENRVRSMATQLQAKFEENSSALITRGKVRLTRVGR